MKLTYEEFKKLPMQYVLGINRDDYCARKYWNEQFNINKEVVTERVEAGNIYSGFKDPLVSFYRGNDGDIYNSARELYEGEFLSPWFELAIHKPVYEGWYETNAGMAYWSTEKKWFTNAVAQFTTQWRGMADVPAKEAA